MMPLEQVYKNAEGKMIKTMDATLHEFQQVRTGRASPALVENIKIDYYNTPTPLKQVAAISTPDPRLIVIQPWDQSTLQDIERGLQRSELGVSPVVDGKIIRVPLPALTQDRREELVKLIKKMAEDGKVALRSIRRDANDHIKTLKKSGDATEDDERKGLDKIQTLTNDYTAKIDALFKAKEKEILEF